jgi:hypothetical protein
LHTALTDALGAPHSAFRAPGAASAVGDAAAHTMRAMALTPTSAVTHPERGDGARTLRRRRAVYVATTVALCVVMSLALADLFWPVLGVDSASAVDAAPDGTSLRVEYPSVTRPALASPFAIEVSNADGFDEPIMIAVDRTWIEVWDENGMYPSPASEVGEADYVVWEFDPPEGTVFRFFYDARLEPARQRSVEGRVQLRDDAEVLAEVEFTTKVRP